MSEIRKDPVTGKWVITLDDREFMPQQGRGVPQGLPEKDESCPFCPGNEEKTAIPIYSNAGNGSWQVRVIPNSHPYLRVEPQLHHEQRGLYHVISGTGANEVIIEGRSHNADFEDMDSATVAAAFMAYKARMSDLTRDTRLEYALVFKNRGPAAGANLNHLHSQLIALPVVPKTVREELEHSQRHFEETGKCVYCEMIKDEAAAKERVVIETGDFLVIEPFASQTPFETWVLPKKHLPAYQDSDDRLLAGLADVMKDSIRRINKALNKPSYNYMIHTAPLKSPHDCAYHWHIEILPRIKSIAGFEWGSGFFINPTLPEHAAAYLRGL